eukprot:COSAG02_NODE_1074_length_14765_cov_23.566685_7_plen_79_part_00
MHTLASPGTGTVRIENLTGLTTHADVVAIDPLVVTCPVWPLPLSAHLRDRPRHATPVERCPLRISEERTTLGKDPLWY